MSLSKEIVIDKMEVLENGCVQVRQATKIIEDDKVLSTSYHRWVVVPGQDYSAECDKVKAICQATHTEEVINAYQAMLEAQRNI